MTALVVLLPLGSAAVLAAIADWRLAARVNLGSTLATLLAACSLFAVPMQSGRFLQVDAFNIYLVVLTAFVAATTAWFSLTYLAHEVANGRLDAVRVKLYHAMYQVFLGAMLLALLSNNLGVMWVAMEAATISTVLMVALYRTHAAIEAAWKYFILCGVGIALGLFGIIVLYLAALPVLGAGMDSLTFSLLLPAAEKFNPAILNLAFVFLLVGFGTKVGLAPFHAWLPDAHAEGPTPISAVLSGLLLNVALYVVVRFRMLLAGNPGAIAAGPLMVLLGIVSLLLAAYSLWHRRDIKRFFAYSSIEHMGLITLAFGLGGPVANFAGLLHMTMHSLTKSAIFFAVGHIVQLKGSQKFADVSGLVASQPALGWGLVAAVAAIAGLPPFGVFVPKFLLVSSVAAAAPWLVLPLGAGLLVALAALVARLSGMAFGPATPDAGPAPRPVALLPLWLHLGLVLLAGLWLPPPLVGWFNDVARLLG